MPLESKTNDRNTRASSITSKSSRKRKAARKKKAKEWTYYIELLKKPLDCIYEICRQDRNINACKEVLMYLQNADRDFSSLITAINLEDSYDVENKPQCVAWEVRKMTKSPTQALVNVLPISPLMVDQLKLLPPANQLDRDEKDPCEIGTDAAGWQVVRSRRRPSMSSTISDVMDTLDSDFSDVVVPSRALSVYERLSSSAAGGGSHNLCRRHSSTSRAGYASIVSSGTMTRSKTASGTGSSSNISFSRYNSPRSVMDLPQTKSSMAKISYCRQRIWEKDVQPSLAEKIRLKKMKESASKVNISNTLKHGAGHNADDNCDEKLRSKHPDVKPSSCGLNRAVSLKAIKETTEADEIEPVSIASLTATTRAQLLSNVKRCESSRSLPVHSVWGLDLARDREWRELTEEEESLAMEELSINAEIEEARSELDSLDVDLLKQDTSCDLDVATAEYSTIPEFPLMTSTSAIDQKILMAKLEEGYKQFCQESWSDIVEKEFAGQYHEPGQLAEKHDKLCSPVRKRERDDPAYPAIQAEKLRRAEELREEIQRDKAHRLKELSQKREDLKRRQAALAERKRIHLEARMEKAHENKEKELAKIVKKAKEDEQKVMEVRFIQSCTEDNKRMDREARAAVLEERKQTIADERARRAEEKAAKEHAAEERRVQAEQERVIRLQEKQERRKVRHAEYTQQKTEAELELRQRRRLLKERKEELKQQTADSKQIKETKSHEKSEASSQRHSDSLNMVRQRAQQLSSPRTASAWMGLIDPTFWPADKATVTDELTLMMMKCDVCNVLIASDLEAMAHVVSSNHLGNVKVDLSAADDVTAVLDCQLDSLSRFSMEDSLTSIDSGAGTETDGLTDCDQPAVGVISSVEDSCLEAVQESDRKFSAAYIDPPVPAKTVDRRLPRCLSQLTATDFSQRLDSSAKRNLHRHVIDLLKLCDTPATLAANGKASASVAAKFVEAQMILESSSDDSLCGDILSATSALCSFDHFAARTLFSIPTLGSVHHLNTSGKTGALVLPTFAEKFMAALQAPIATDHCDLVNLINLLKHCMKGSDKRDWKSCGLSSELITERIQLIESDLQRHDLAGGIQQLLSSGTEVPLFVVIALSTLGSLFVRCDATETSVSIVLTRALLSYCVSMLRQPNSGGTGGSVGSDSHSADTRPSSPRRTREESAFAGMSSSALARVAFVTLNLCSVLAATEPMWKVLLSNPISSFHIYLLLTESLRACRSISNDQAVEKNVVREIGPLWLPMGLATRFAVAGPSQKALCTVGWQRSLLSSLAAVPLRYLVNRQLQSYLIPALIAITAQSRSACQLLSRDIGLTFLLRFLKRTSSVPAFHDSLKQVVDPDEWPAIQQFYTDILDSGHPL